MISSTTIDTKSLYKAIRRECAVTMGNMNNTEIAHKFNVSPRTVTRACREDKDRTKNNYYPLPTDDVGADFFFEGMREHIDELKDAQFSDKEKSIFLVMCNKLKTEGNHYLLPDLIAMMKRG